MLARSIELQTERRLNAPKQKQARWSDLAGLLFSEREVAYPTLRIPAAP